MKPSKFTLLVFGVACAAPLRSVAAEPAKPNIIVILADDFGYGSAGCYGADGRLVQTPHLDRLAKEGRRFTDANTTSSVCSPTRYSLLTGRYCWRTSLKSGVLGTFSPLHLEPARLNLASLLKKHGYRTAAIGKWHLGYGMMDDSPKWRTDFTGELSPGPLDIGFDYHFGVPANHGDLTGVFVENRYVYGLRSGKIPDGMKLPGPDADDDHFKATYTKEDTENGRATILDLDAPRRVNERVMPMLTRQAVRWIAQQKSGTPFFLHYTPVAVHNPITPDKDLAGRSSAGPFGDWIHELDRSVGAVLAALDQTGLAEETLVIFTSDNGGVNKPERAGTPQTQAIKAGLAVNGALRGGKHTVWEGGFKVPFIVRWPGRAPAGSRCSEMVSVADLLATVAAVVGEKLPAASAGAEDSFNILPAILGDTAAKPARTDLIVHSSDGVFALRKGPWKWIEGVPVDSVKGGARNVRSPEFKAQLYDVQKDPGETKDVSAEHPEVVREFAALLNRYRDGGYSRELPPVVERAPAAVTLPPLAGEIVLREPLDKLPGNLWKTKGRWVPADGGLAGAQPPEMKPGANLHGPLGITDGTIDYEIRFQGAERHSLRIETADGQGGFRVEVSRTHLGITKNPGPGEGLDKVEPLARKPLELAPDHWHPVRVTFRGTQATARVGGVVVTASQAILGQPKTAMNLLVFGERAVFRNVTVARAVAPQP